MSTTVHFAHGVRPQRSFQNKEQPGSLCGADPHNFDYYATSPDRITCPKCSAKWAKDEMKKRDRQITLERDEDYGYRSAYKVLIDGVHYAMVTLDTGKRQDWELRMHNRDRPGNDRPLREGSFRVYRDYFIRGRKSKEQAALDILDNLQYFQPYEDYLAKVKASNERAEKNRRLFEDERAREKQAREEALATLNEMLKRDDLSNLEISAINVSIETIKTVSDFA